MIYDINGTALNSIKDVDGENLDQAYDINGNPLFQSYDLTVMTYNYNWCVGINSQVAMQQAIIGKYKPDVVGIQEACNQSDVTQRVEVGSFPAITSQFLGDYPYKVLSTQATNKNGIVSKREISSYQNVRYTDYDDEYWDYQKGYITVNGKQIAIFNTHLTWRDNSASSTMRIAQASELFNAVKNEQYAVITGDFNSYAHAFTDAEYIGIFKPFADAGFKLANCNTEVGFNPTFSGLTNPTVWDGFTSACDNVIVSPSIDIVGVDFDLTRLDYLNGDKVDHIPVVARLKIN